jgi:hypothetical protein
MRKRTYSLPSCILNIGSTGYWLVSCLAFFTSKKNPSTHSMGDLMGPKNLSGHCDEKIPTLPGIDQRSPAHKLITDSSACRYNIAYVLKKGFHELGLAHYRFALRRNPIYNSNSGSVPHRC